MSVFENRRVVDISRAHTRFLLKELRKLNWIYNCSLCGSHDDEPMFHQFGTDHDMTPVGFIADADGIRDELSKRENILSKREGQAIRRKKSMKQHGRSKGKDR